MDAITGFVSENWMIAILCLLAAVGLFWLLSRFFKLTLIVALAVILLLAFQHFSSSGDMKTKFSGFVDRITGKAGDAMKGTKDFFSAQKGNMQKHVKDALGDEDKKK